MKAFVNSYKNDNTTREASLMLEDDQWGVLMTGRKILRKW